MELKETLLVHFAAFDILYLNGEHQINKSLKECLDTLNSVLKNDLFISICSTYSNGTTLFDRVVDIGLKRIVSKHLNKPYILDSRPKDVFLKIKNYQKEIVTIGAIRKKSFGWVMLKDNEYKGVLEFVSSTERKAFYGVFKQLILREDENYIYLANY